MRLGLRVLLAVVLVGMLTGMAWAGGLFYWHFRIERIIRYLEDAGADCALPVDLENRLYDAGCRAVPNLIRSSGPERPPAFLAITTHVAISLINRDRATKPGECSLRGKAREEMQVETDDPAPLRAAKVARLQSWWSEHGGEIHQWWRFWTGNCRGTE
jgi:hypothetical protein